MFLNTTVSICQAVLLGAALTLPARAAEPPASVEFVENRGQWPAPVSYAARLVAGQLFLEPQGFTYALLENQPHHAAEPGSATPTPARRGHAYRVHFEGSRPAGAPTGEQATGQLSNFMLGSDPSAWVGAVPAFRAVQYEQLYPGTSLRVYENASQQLEYTFTVQPGGQPAAIGLRYEGTEGLSLDAEGNLRIATSVGAVTELAPRAWQTTAGGRQEPVACAFVLEKNTVRFRLGRYDAGRPLVIDPVVLFATFTGSPTDNWGHTATYDAQGNLYSAGTVFNTGYPTSPGAFDTSFNGSVDVAIIKYNTGSRGPAARAYATYLGGRESEAPHRLVVDAQGELVVLGTTSSADFPTTAGAYDRRFNGGPTPQTGTNGITYSQGIDLFITRLSPDGRRLQASTFLGGSGTDGFAFGSAPIDNAARIEPATPMEFLGDVQLDAAGNVCLASSTTSRDFPVQAAYSPTYRGGLCDAVVCQLSPDLQQLRWSTFLGGNEADAAFALVPDRRGGFYIAGGTRSPDFPFSAGAYQAAARGLTDAYVAHLDASGRILLAAARLSTAHDDVARLIQLDTNGNVLVLGQSHGLMPVTPGCYGVPGHDFLQQLSPDLSRLQFAACLASAAAVYPMADIALGVDACDRIYIAARANTTEVLGLSLTPAPASSRFCLAMRLSAGARTLDYATTLPGEHIHGTSQFDKHGTLYLAVCGNCAGVGSFSLPGGVNSFANHPGRGLCNDASFKVDLSPGPTAAEQAVCADAPPLPLGGSPSGGIWAGPGVVPAPGGFQFVPSAALLGTQVLTYTPAGSSCPVIRQRFTVTAPVPVTLAPVGPACYSPDNPVFFRLSAQPAGGFFFGPGVKYNYLPFNEYEWLFDVNAAGPGTHTITYSLGQGPQCGLATQSITIHGAPVRLFPSDTVLCTSTPRPMQLSATPAGGTWSGPGVSPSGYWSPATQQLNNYKLSYTYTGPEGCVTQKSTTISVVAPPLGLSTLPPLPRCATQPAYNGLAPFTVDFPAQVPFPFAYYWEYGDGTFSPGFSGRIPPEKHTYAAAGTYRPVLHVLYGSNCTQTAQFGPIEVGEPQLLPNIITPNGDGLNDFFIQREFCEQPALRVFSRWGQEVYRADAYRNDWNATGLPAGTYYYRFVGEQGRSVKGWLEVQR